MAITNVFSITYGDLTVGGDSSTLQLSGPYVIDRSHSRLRLVFDVVVVATSYETLQSLSESVEAAFSARDQDVEIDISGSLWTYTSGTTLLNSVASCSKTGNRDTDRGYSRSYTCTIEGELPADDQDGLRELEVHTDYSPSRQKTVTMRGVYTPQDGDTATETYEAEFDARATAILTSIDAGATWELVHEDNTRDRNNFTTQFTRQYVEILVAQTVAALNDDEIHDHRVSFTDLSTHPGDSQDNVHRLRRVVANYDCAVDIDETQDLKATFDEKVLPHLIALFVSNFAPGVYGMESVRFGMDKSTNRISASAQFIYQSGGGGDVLEVTESTTTREIRTIDYTPVHNGREFAAYADAGWSTRERTYSRTSMVLGEETPKEPLTARFGSSALPPLGGSSNDASLASGWNKVQDMSQLTPQWIGDPTYGQVRVTIVSETVVKRYHERP